MDDVLLVSSIIDAEATKNSSLVTRGHAGLLESDVDGDGDKEDDKRDKVVDELKGGGGLSSGSSSKLVGVEPVEVKVMLPGPPMKTGCRNVILEKRP